jgi:hypothetical protein
MNIIYFFDELRRTYFVWNGLLDLLEWMIMGEEEWLSLRRENKEHCYRCGFNLSSSEISGISEIEFQAIMDGSQKTICCRCKTKRRRQKLFMITAIALMSAAALAFLILN